MEQIELEHHRHHIQEDVRKLVEKYRAIFDWDVPGVNQARADQMIVAEIHRALGVVDQTLAQ